MGTIALSVLMMMVAAGCGTVRSTPAQDVARHRWQTCDHFATVRLERIDLNGRLVMPASEHEAASFAACVE